MGSFKTQLATVKCQHQVPVRGNVEASGAFEVKFDLARIAAGIYIKVVLQPALLAIESEIYLRINVAVLHPRKLRNVVQPARGVIADEIVAMAREPVGPTQLSIRIRAA